MKNKEKELITINLDKVEIISENVALDILHSFVKETINSNPLNELSSAYKLNDHEEMVFNTKMWQLLGDTFADKMVKEGVKQHISIFRKRT